METRKSIFSFLVGLGITVLIAVTLPYLGGGWLSWPVTLALAVAVGFFVRESIQQELRLPQRGLLSVGVGVIIYLGYQALQWFQGGI